MKLNRTYGRAGLCWTSDEIDFLRTHWGVESVAKLSQQLQRSPVSIEHYATRQLKLGGYKRGTKSIRCVSRQTGYSESTICNVIYNLGIVVSRVERGVNATHKHARITYEQEQRIIQYLKDNFYRTRIFNNSGKKTHSDKWGVGNKPPECIDCHRTDRPHSVKGRCKLCYNRFLYHQKKKLAKQNDVHAKALD